MKRIIAVLVLLAGMAYGQQTSSGSLTAATTDCSIGAGCVTMALSNAGGATISLSGAFVATVQFEVSNDGGVTYTSGYGTPLAGGTSVSSSTGTGFWSFPVSGITHIRARVSAYTSGTVVVKMSAGSPSARGSGGSGTPGGATTQVQFNDAGVFGGDSGLTYDKTNKLLLAGAGVPNDGATGTTLAKLAKYSGTNFILTGTTDTAVPVYIVVSGAGTTGSSYAAAPGSQASCVFDGATTAGHWVKNSGSVAGDCSDTSTLAVSTCYVGTVTSTNGGGGTYTVAVQPFCTPPSGAGIGYTITLTTAPNNQTPANASTYYFGALGAAPVIQATANCSVATTCAALASSNIIGHKVMKACTIKAVDYYLNVAGTKDTAANNITLSILNATSGTNFTDTNATVTAQTSSLKLAQTTGASDSLAAGDVIVAQIATPTFTTPPTNVQYTAVVYCE